MLINVALCVLGWIPGMIHSWYIISVTPDRYEYERIVDIEAGSRIRRDGGVGTYYVAQPRGRRGVAPPQQQRAIAPRPAPPANNGVPALKPAEQQPYGIVVGSSQQQSGEAPPPYSEGIVGDHKVQKK